MCIAIGGVVGVIAYRISVLASLQLLDKDSKPDNSTLTETKHVITTNASIITTITAACINLALIILLNIVSKQFICLLLTCQFIIIGSILLPCFLANKELFTVIIILLLFK